MSTLGLLFGCQNEIPDISMVAPPSHEEVHPSDLEEMLVLGAKLENPYTVSNMEEALRNLRTTAPDGSPIQEHLNIRTTHQYIRFHPKNWDEHGTLSRDKNLTLSTFPLDYEVIGSGSQYHNPSIPLKQPTYQYAAVRSEQEFPKIEYEVLADLYIPEEDFELQKSPFADILIESLVDEALRITNNLEDNPSDRHPKWTPSGRIRVWDDSTGAGVPIEGIEVRAWRWFRTLKGTTDSAGYFTCGGKFHYSARYYLYWKAYDFDFRCGFVGLAFNWGPYKRGDWDENIKGGRQEFYGTIFRATHHYYYEDILDLKKPPLNIAGRPKLKIAAHYYPIPGVPSFFNPFFAGTQLNWIHFFRKNETIRNYSVMIHELAHAAHWERDHQSFYTLLLKSAPTKSPNPCGASFNAIGALKVIESWAKGVQWALTKQVYPTYMGPASSPDSAKICPNGEPYYYTPIVIDLVDTQGGAPNHSAKYPIDKVSSYSMGQIENALIGTTSWNEWRDAIKNKYSNPTEQHVDSLFLHWTIY